MNVLDKHIVITAPDGSKWSVPVREVAINRSKYYADVDGKSIEAVMRDDTLPLFENSEEILDWAVGNMDWGDVQHTARLVSRPAINFQEVWMNGVKNVVDVDQIVGMLDEYLKEGER